MYACRRGYLDWRILHVVLGGALYALIKRLANTWLPLTSWVRDGLNTYLSSKVFELVFSSMNLLLYEIHKSANACHHAATAEVSS